MNGIRLIHLLSLTMYQLPLAPHAVPHMQERMDGIESKRRNRPVEESLAVWKEMVGGSEEGRKHCMRFKINMQDPNKAMRDPVGYRCNDTPHWRTGTKYKACS